MTRAIRNYEHRDFSALLEELKNGVNEKPIKFRPLTDSKEPDPWAPIVPKEKRLRDSLMSNPKMRYAYSDADGILHDRDCVRVKDIPDKQFRMLSDFSTEMKPCPQCHRRALIRAMVTDGAKRMDAYEHIFKHINANLKELYTLMLGFHAQAYDVGRDYVCLKVKDDKWMVRSVNDELFLYHNNYTVLEDYTRLFSSEFHLQSDSGGHTFRQFVHIMTNYSWPAHVRTRKAQALEEQRQELRNQLRLVENWRKLKCFSLFFDYYIILDCNKKACALSREQGLELKKTASEAILDTPYRIQFCRIRRWKRNRFIAAMNALKEYCITNNHFDYAEQCKGIQGDDTVYESCRGEDRSV